MKSPRKNNPGSTFGLEYRPNQGIHFSQIPSQTSDYKKRFLILDFSQLSEKQLKPFLNEIGSFEKENFFREIEKNPNQELNILDSGDATDTKIDFWKRRIRLIILSEILGRMDKRVDLSTLKINLFEKLKSVLSQKAFDYCWEYACDQVRADVHLEKISEQ